MITADAYAAAVHLDEPFVPMTPEPRVSPAQARREVLAWLFAEYAGSAKSVSDVDVENDVPIRNLLTVRRPGRIPSRTLAYLDQILGEQARARGSVMPDEVLAGPGTLLTVGGTQVKVWRGDITRLSVDAIVNAANAGLLGCFRPGHACIDNAIHRAAGPRLREDCARIIEIQDHAERSGDAKITRAYHLPSRFVLHTVGPIVAFGGVEPDDERMLVSSYDSCLELAGATPSIRSFAFCAISTGIFGYPKDRAANVAVRTVSRWLRERPKGFDLVVFCVFSDADGRAYDQAMAVDGEDRIP
jgi:O-acetyl-ADP-ribose deacetylase (regulator of RNase III)